MSGSPIHFLRTHPSVLRYLFIRVSDELASQMLNVALGWYVYDVTHNPLSLAYVGLAQFFPNLFLALFAGHAVDRFERRKVIGLSLTLQTIALTAFSAWFFLTANHTARPVYILLLLMGCARSFSFPAMAAILPRAVEDEEFPRAVAVTSSTSQVCTLIGPAIGGLLYAINANALLIIITLLYLYAASQSFLLKLRPTEAAPQSSSDTESIFAGVRYVWTQRLLFALISLDLFAVLLGGVTALLPIYAKDILHTGPTGLGLLRCATGAGAAVMGLALAHRSITKNAGRLMLSCVAGFGAATVVFAISKNFYLSFASLFVAGAFDMVSMVIRHTLVTLCTPDAMRGRVSAVNGVFIGASNEFGEFESGIAASLFGTVPAALIGGIGTLVVVAIWSRLFPELRATDTLSPVSTDAIATDS